MKTQLQNLIIKIDSLKTNSEEFDRGITAARDLLIRELHRIDCPACKRKENEK